MRAASRPATTSCSSATAASTDRLASTAREVIAAREHSRTCSARSHTKPSRRHSAPAPERVSRRRRGSRRVLAAPAGGRPRARAPEARLRDPIDLVSESAGTRTAMIYAWRYPRSVHRSVMIGVNPPGNFLWDAQTTGEQIRRYAALCARAATAAAGRTTSPPQCTRRTTTSRAAGGSCRSRRATSRRRGSSA